LWVLSKSLEREGNWYSDVVKVEGDNLATPGWLREDRVRRYVTDSKSWMRVPSAHSRGNPGTVMIPQY